MNDKCSGLILKKMDYKENDEMIKVLTKEYGLLTFIAKGTKKITSKNRNLLNPFMEIEILFDYVENKDLFVFKSGRVLKNFNREKSTFNELHALTIVNDLVYECVSNYENTNYLKYYNALIWAYDSIYNNLYLTLMLIESFVLRNEGLSPNVDGCAICNEKKVVSISKKAGGFTCLNHRDSMEEYSQDTLRKFRYIVKADLKDYDVLKEYDYTYQDLMILSAFISDNDKIIKSIKYLKD